MTTLAFTTPLHPDEELVLRALRSEMERVEWRACEVARAASLPYQRAWLAMNRLHGRGYVRRDLLARWWVSWESVDLPHRAQVSIDLLEPGERWLSPSRWERLLDWVLRHFGGSWEER